jgi:predicted DNA-binding protein (MmcQ/YjbR family)
MNVEELREYCLLKKGTEESFPFDDKTLVFKVANKIYLLLSLESNPVQFNAKCEPNKAIELREKHSAIIPGYHMNKQHWNTIICDQSLSSKLIFNCIDDSYELIVNSLTKKTRVENGL